MQYTIEHPVDHVRLDFVSAGIENCDPGHSWGPGMRDYDMLHFTGSGSGHYYVNNRYYEIGAHHCFYVPSHTPVFYYADVRNPWSYCWTDFRGDDVRRTLSLCGLSSEHPVIAISNYDAIRRSIDQILRFPKRTPSNDLLIQGTFLQIIGILMSSRQSVLTPLERLDDGLVKNAVDYINKCVNSDLKVCVEDVANQLFVSRAYLFEVFRTHLGISPRQFILNARMSRAAELLTKTREPIDLVAKQCGYKSPNAFSRAFRRENMLNPSEYRRLRSLPNTVLR